jgi:hypothetical protein
MMADVAGEERRRNELWQRLSDLMGPDLGAYLMERLPPFPWSDLVTKAELQGMEQRLDLRLTAVRDALHVDFRDQTSRILTWTVGSVVVTSVAVAVVVAGLVTALG